MRGNLSFAVSGVVCNYVHMYKYAHAHMNAQMPLRRGPELKMRARAYTCAPSKEQRMMFTDRAVVCAVCPTKNKDAAVFCNVSLGWTDFLKLSFLFLPFFWYAHECFLHVDRVSLGCTDVLKLFFLFLFFGTFTNALCTWTESHSAGPMF